MTESRSRVGGRGRRPAWQGIDASEAREAPSIIVPLVRELSEHLCKRRPNPGKWSVHEHACHLAAVQPMVFERLELSASDARRSTAV
jgi:hypothetical protein